MTATTERPAVERADDTSAAAGTPAVSPPPKQPAPPPRRMGALGARIVLTVALAAALLLGFLAYLFAFSGVAMHREQTNLRKTLEKRLGEATAPVGPTASGEPVAAIDIPALDIHTMVVVEGTSSRDLMSGPGHLPSTVLPGQSGVSVIYGKRSTFGAPFADLAKLAVGDRIRVTTGLGVATYAVSSFGTEDRPPPANSDNRLLLVTGDSTTWSPKAIAISADLRSTALPSTSGPPVTADNQQPGARDVGSSLIPLAGWSQLLLLTALVGTLALLRWPRWPVVLCLGPVLVAVLWSVYENAAGLLPNYL